MDPESTHIGRVIDDALRELLGTDGFDTYLVLCRQTLETRDRIERVDRTEFPRYLAEEVGRVANRVALTPAIVSAARMRAHERVQREVGPRVAAEEQRFKNVCDRLFRWVAERLDGGCEGCDH